jgi:hypothetical protein
VSCNHEVGGGGGTSVSCNRQGRRCREAALARWKVGALGELQSTRPAVPGSSSDAVEGWSGSSDAVEHRGGSSGMMSGAAAMVTAEEKVVHWRISAA